MVSCSSGHQVANYGPGRNKVDNYFSDRNRKLKEQAAPKVRSGHADLLIFGRLEELTVRLVFLAQTNDLFRGVTVWIDGLVSSAGMSNLELTRLVSTKGGSISCVSSWKIRRGRVRRALRVWTDASINAVNRNAPGSRVTHILSSTPLSGSKMQKLMVKARGWKPAVVKPEWVVESVALGKRASVGKFSILQASEVRS